MIRRDEMGAVDDTGGWWNGTERKEAYTVVEIVCVCGKVQLGGV